MTGFASTISPLADTWHHWGHGGPGWWIAFMVLFWLLLVGGIVVLLRSSDRWRGRARPGEHESALEVLDRRFAEGQLSVEDYQNRRGTLSADQDGD